MLLKCVAVPSGDSEPVVSELLTAQQVAERLDVGTDWIYAQVRAGLIPHLRLGRLVRFHADSIEAWLRDIERSAYNGRPTAAAARRD
jgi:excisionase family DNA binding protein